MKKLIFVRHSKAEDPAPGISDFERSLTLKGKVISKTMASILKEKESSPGVIVTSPAFRAFETAAIFAEVFGISPDKMILSSNIYHNLNLKTLNQELSKVSEEESIVTLFGHNPSFTELAGMLSKQGCEFMRKCGIVGISFKIDSWSKVCDNRGNIEYYLKPEK